MEIKVIDSDKKDYLDLLLLADEQESMIDRYLDKGTLFALYDGDLKSVCVVTKESDDICELKNIATYEKWHGKGYGSALLNHIFSYYNGKYATMLVGTGDVPQSLRFYEKNGFKISHRINNFFTDNYDHLMFEDGVQLVDMIYLSKTLCHQWKEINQCQKKCALCDRVEGKHDFKTIEGGYYDLYKCKACGYETISDDEWRYSMT